jgi:hypothetical protein
MMEEKFIEKQLKEYGYTRKNLYTRENRVPLKTTKIFFPDLTEVGNWNGSKEERIIYVTKYFASKMPDNIILALNWRDGRYIFEKEEDLFANVNFNILHSFGPAFDDTLIPHIILEEELREGLKFLYD